jgi:hypothetical protein
MGDYFGDLRVEQAEGYTTTSDRRAGYLYGILSPPRDGYRRKV